MREHAGVGISNHNQNETGLGTIVPPLPHLAGPGIVTATKKRFIGVGLILNGIAFLIGSAFLLWASGFLLASVTETYTPGSLSTIDLVCMSAFSFLGFCSIARLVHVFRKWSQTRKEKCP